MTTYEQSRSVRFDIASAATRWMRRAQTSGFWKRFDIEFWRMLSGR